MASIQGGSNLSRRLLLPLAALLGLLAAPPASANTTDPSALNGLSAEAQGLALFLEKDRRESGYGDLRVDLEMVLRDRSGAESRRELSISQLEMPDAGDRLLVVFDTPRPIRGTALLTHSHPEAPDDQWLFLPAQRRVKKIASRNKSGPFLSSEFAFEDLTLQDVAKFEYRLLGRETCESGPCVRVERLPLDEFSGYSRQEVLLHEETLRVERIDYYDRHGRPLKVLKNDGWHLHLDRFWKPERMFMENLQTGKTTELVWKDYTFMNGLLPERDFSTNSLMRAR